MDRSKETKIRSTYVGLLAAMVLLVVPSLGLYAPSFAVQYQSQQSATIIVASTNENMTATSEDISNTTTSVTNETTTAGAPNATLVEFVSNIEQIRGHLDQAALNKEAGNNTLAQAHTLHPIEEVYTGIEDQLTNQNSTLNHTMSTALQNISSSVTNATTQDLEGQIDYVNMLLNNSVQAVVPSLELTNNAAFNASVVGRLLHIAGHEYEEAVANGTITEIIEYQDAQAFIQRAQNTFSSSASRINQSMTSEVEEVNELFSNLNDVVSNKEDPATVETTINGIILELAEITGLAESQLIGE